MPDFGIQISDIKNVKTSLPRELSLNSQEKYFKAFKQGEIAINVTGTGSFSVEVVHGLGYVPAYIFFAAFDINNLARRYVGEAAASGVGGTIGSDSYMTAEKLVLGWNEPDIRSYPFKITFYYYIFYDVIE